MAIEERSEINHKILYQINKAIEKLTNDIELLCIIGSYGDTQEDEDVLQMLEEYNKYGTATKEIICSISDTPETRRKRFKVINPT